MIGQKLVESKQEYKILQNHLKGPTRTIEAVGKIKDGESKQEKGVGEVKILKIDEMLSIQDVDVFEIPSKPGEVSGKDLK